MTDAKNNDLWPSFDDVDQTRTPAAIVRELGAALAAKTNNLVEAVVRPNGDAAQASWFAPNRDAAVEFAFTLVLSAPVLRYTYGLLSLQHGIELWPLKLRSPVLGNGDWMSIANEEELRLRLAEAFGHPTTAKVIRSMISQSRDVGTQEVHRRDERTSKA